jgi:hypothetical protein
MFKRGFGPSHKTISSRRLQVLRGLTKSSWLYVSAVLPVVQSSCTIWWSQDHTRLFENWLQLPFLKLLEVGLLYGYIM